MIQIGFCDDDPSVLDELHELLGSYRAEHNADIAPTAFQSPFELLASIEKGARFDILLLDVLMPGENGIEAAREIRQYDSNVKIIFLTSSAEFAVQSYTVGAYFYQLKPIWPESFFRLMDSVSAACSRESSVSLILRCRTGITRVELDKLEYCEVIRRSLLLHKTDGTVARGRRQHGQPVRKPCRTQEFSAYSPLLPCKFRAYPDDHAENAHHVQPRRAAHSARTLQRHQGCVP